MRLPMETCMGLTSLQQTPPDRYGIVLRILQKTSLVREVVMKVLSCWLRKQLTGCLILLLVFPLAEPTTSLAQQAPAGAQQPSASSNDGAQQQPGNASQTVQPPAAPPASGQSSTDQQQNGTNKPVGTAAAPVETTSGVAASRPAGAVIAPAKQHRARAILIRVSIVVAAAVAVGVVVGLSKSSPNRPD
jgi:hypothetical protein